jgi:hypothetical protein
MSFNMATVNMNSTDECNGYFSGPVAIFEKSFCAMRACSEHLYAMNICCKGATVMPYVFVADPHSNLTKGVEAGGFYCLVGDMTWSTWENCTIAQGVQGGICATDVERFIGWSVEWWCEGGTWVVTGVGWACDGVEGYDLVKQESHLDIARV